tara:strand:- start:75 stop:677 length:603 start_codon:yes stop_codon:yes gene_type:complete
MINKVYFINLNHRIDRKSHIEQLLKNSGLDTIAERISAVNNPIIGAAGCTVSHILTLERFIGSKENYCLVLEDDFTLDDPTTLKDNIKKVFDDKVDFDVVQISGNHVDIKECNYSYLKTVKDSQTTSGYIVNRRFANTLLENFKECYTLMSKLGKCEQSCLDIHWKILQPISKWYCFSPPLGYQMDGYSDVEKFNTSYKC